MIIKTKQDVEAFLKKFKNDSVFIFRDSDLSMSGGGATRITFDGEYFYQFSSGMNWSDQQKEVISDPTAWIWRKRNGINQGEFI